jgi:hypothetical protein
MKRREGDIMTSMYSSRKKGEHLRRIYMTGRKREKICMRWQLGRSITLQIMTVYWRANIFLTGK